MLCEEYERRARPDLADCVKKGRKYQRLEYVVGNVILFHYAGSKGEPWLMGILNGMVDSFLGPKAGPLPEAAEEWVEWALARHSDVPGLPEVMELESKSKLFLSQLPVNTSKPKEKVKGDSSEEPAAYLPLAVKWMMEFEGFGNIDA
jgi:hypothetical protein